MPKIITPTPDLNSSVMRPVVYGIVRDILQRTGLSSDTPIIYPDEFEGVRQMGSAMTTEDENRFRASNQIEIETKETYDEARLMSTPVMRQEYRSVFSDKGIQTAIFPVMSRTELEISVRFRARDKTTATRWRDDIRARFGQGRSVQTHQIEYNYALPVEFINRLMALHELREKQAGYGQTFDEWMSQCLTRRATIATDVAGGNGAWVIGERQIEVTGWFDFVTPEEATRESDPTGWTTSFTYKTQYDKPIELCMFHPVIVHNQVIPKEYRQSTTLLDTRDRVKEYGNTTGLIDQYSAGHVYRFTLPGPGAIIPYWDEFYTRNTLPQTVTLATMLTAITAEDRKSLLNFNDLGERTLDSDILAFLLNRESSFVARRRQSVFFITLYEDEDFVDSSRITLSSDGRLSAVSDLSLRRTYHVRLSVHLDWRNLAKPALDRLRQHPVVVIKLLRFLGYATSAVNNGVFSNNTNILDVSSLSLTQPIPETKMKVIADQTSQSTHGNVGQDKSFITVGSFFITAARSRP